MSVMKVKHILLLCVMGFFSLTTYGQIYSSSNSRITTTKEKKKRNFVNDTASYNRVYAGFMKNFLVVSWEHGQRISNGAELGYLRGVSLTKKCPIFLDLGARISLDTEHQEESDPCLVSSRRRVLLAASVPVSLTFKRTFVNRFYLAPYLGPHLRVDMLGIDKVKIHWEQGSYSFDDESKYSLFNEDETEYAMKRVQFGFQFGLNFGYKALSFGVGCNTDVLKLHKMGVLGLSGSVGINF